MLQESPGEPVALPGGDRQSVLQVRSPWSLPPAVGLLWAGARGRGTGLRWLASPAPALAIKRSDTAPVTLRGWLYKQGSDGLQLWKKRWFVLSEYCLFYYKGKEVIVITNIPFFITWFSLDVR